MILRWEKEVLGEKNYTMRVQANAWEWSIGGMILAEKKNHWDKNIREWEVDK